ncbi:MAG: metal resistance protein [Deltaproteobacteria bacterium CG11_big_fil_rev_8_21_14_0_20_45_16]|nr:MAG: metal resistance protein [Deltaproteobacteria bacterium CG11_big_fil_rev_8_21_14_0_20_45_16]
MGAIHQSHPDIINRLHRAQGHLNKVVQMIEQDEGCLEVAQQFHAVVEALNKAKKIFIHDHIEHCLEHVAIEPDSRSRRKQLAEFKEIYKFL